MPVPRIHRGILLSWALVAAFLAGVVLSPAEGMGAALKAAPEGHGAMGQLRLYDLGQNQRLVSILAAALDVDSVYTVWLVNRGDRPQRVGVGGGDHLFKSDDRGIGAFTAILSASEIGKWERLEIGYHPDGLASNVREMEIVLRLDLDKVR